MKANRDKLELAMASACLTPAALAKLANMPRSTLNGVISGRSVMPATLGRVARALAVPVEQIAQDCSN